MIVKGLISSINTEASTVDVILPEYENIVLSSVRLYREGFIDTLSINDFVLVAVFNSDFNDCMVI